MPAISREQENTPALINWFISIGGVLTDAFLVEYRIFDIIGGLPGTQIFPTAPDYEDVTSAPGKFGTGSYYAYDNTAGTGWTPGPAHPVGTHRIEWRWKASASSPAQAGFEDFEVLLQSVGGSADLYCTVADIRDAGLTDTATYPDADVLAAIELWQAFLERACRQWFNPRTIVLKFDGTDSDTLHFGVPIISIDHIKLNDNTEILDPNNYRVYAGRQYPDDRRNPRVKLRSMSDFPDIFTAPIVARSLRFRKGRQNQEVKGTFGFVEENGLTPKLIQRALCKLVIEKLTNPIPVPGGSPAIPPPPIIAGALLEEVTDGHKRKYGDTVTFTSRRPSPFQGITTDQEILDIIKMYRAPIGIATPAHPSHIDGGSVGV